MVVAVADDDVAERIGAGNAALHAKRQALGSGIDGAARRGDVLGDDGALDVDRRQAGGAQLVRVQIHLNLSLASPDDAHLADAGEVLQCLTKLVVGVFGDLANGPRRFERHEQHGRIAPGSSLLTTGVFGALGQVRQHRRQVVAHLLRGDVDVLVQQ